MTAAAHQRIYRTTVRLYPRAFRRRYGDDLVQNFGDLMSDQGPRAAWTRTSLDLLLTVPRYRLESVMTERHSATTVNIVITLLVAGGLASFLTGMYPGFLLFLAAIVLAVAQRSKLARALRTPDTSARQRRLRIGAILGVVFVVTYSAYLALIGDSWTIRETVLALIGTTAMIGCPVFLIAGLLTPKSPTSPSAQGAIAPG